MSNNSTLYRSLLALRDKTQKELETINNYLESGSLQTTVTWYNAEGKIVGNDKLRSKWTTALGKQRIETNHREFIAEAAQNLPVNVTKIVINSPFVNDGVKVQNVVVRRIMPIEVVHNAI